MIYQLTAGEEEVATKILDRNDGYGASNLVAESWGLAGYRLNDVIDKPFRVQRPRVWIGIDAGGRPARYGFQFLTGGYVDPVKPLPRVGGDGVIPSRFAGKSITITNPDGEDRVAKMYRDYKQSPGEYAKQYLGEFTPDPRPPIPPDTYPLKNPDGPIYGRIEWKPGSRKIIQKMQDDFAVRMGWKPAPEIDSAAWTGRVL